MGMFNSIYADLFCPIDKRVGKDTEIQIKWQKYEARLLEVYHVNDVLEDIEPEFDNNWIRTDYICEICSKGDLPRHFVFVHIVQGKIEEILTEEEFQSRGIKHFVDDSCEFF